MTAGLNLLGTVWRYTFPQDDAVGGAVPTGTPLYTNVEMRIQAEKPTMALLEQGLETPTMFTAVLHPGTLLIEHNDEIQVTAPTISTYYNEHFRVIGMQHTSQYADDTRGFILLNLRRVEIAHALQ